jgi:hypothetical protein
MNRSRVVTNIQKYDTPRVLVVGGERNEHGTRISRKVTCQKCGKGDYIAVSRTKNAASLFCRDCAKSEIKAFEKGTRIKPEMASVCCGQCKRAFDFPKAAQNSRRETPLLCRDCYRGFEVWSGSLQSPGAVRDLAEFSRRPSGTLLRATK